jgi:hypothetical protein
VVIVDGEARGPFGKLFGGILPDGTVITDLNGIPIRTAADYDRAAETLESGGAASFILRIDFSGRGDYSTPQILSLVLPEK